MDRALVERAQHGDHSAFEALATTSLPRLWSVARRVVGNHHEAEDAVQDCLVRAWRDLRVLRDPDRFEAWLYRLLINACRDRGRVAQRARVVELEGVAELSDQADPIAEIERRDQVRRGFARLSPEHRAALVLHHYAGFRAREIAGILGIPEGTVVSRLHYAARAMRTELEADLRLVPAAIRSDER